MTDCQIVSFFPHHMRFLARFQAVPPRSRNFDRSTVKGVVAKLFHIKPDFVQPSVGQTMDGWPDSFLHVLFLFRCANEQRCHRTHQQERTLLVSLLWQDT